MLTILINPTVVTLRIAKSENIYTNPIYTYPGHTEVLAVDKDSNEMAKFTLMPISESQLKLFMEDKQSGDLHESIINRADYPTIEEPMQIMLNRINLTL